MCIYHGNCADGFGGVWAVRRALGDNVEFIAAKHGDVPPDVTGRNVVIKPNAGVREVSLPDAYERTSENPITYTSLYR